jgi:NADH-quinone oxidoreductase subunit M
MEPWAASVAGVASWREVFGLLAVIGIVYGATVALVQRDFKFVIGYSSVSHMGFVLLGLVSLHLAGLTGAVLQMFSHGVIAGLLFGVVGRMVYDRTHTRDFAQLSPLQLSRQLPFAAATFTVAALASMGLPGFSGFVAELQVLSGAWNAFPGFAVLAGLGILIGVAYTLRAVQLSFFPASDGAESRGRAEVPAELPAITWPEKAGAVLLGSAAVYAGLFPEPLIRLTYQALQSSLFEKVLTGGGL